MAIFSGSELQKNSISYLCSPDARPRGCAYCSKGSAHMPTACFLTKPIKKTELPVPKRMLALIPHHLFVIFQALTFHSKKNNNHAEKNNGRNTTLLQDSKACKAKSKIQCRNKIKMGWPWKVKGLLPSDNPAAALPGYVEKW
jgi:hypothetical protein